MAQAWAGKGGSGAVTVYAVPSGYRLALELLRFTLTTDATTGVHSAVVRYYDASLAAVVAEIWDWNEGGASMTLYYTYGIGLRPFNCTVTTGMMIPNNLPPVVLEPDAQVRVAAVDNAGNTLSGDAISNVTLYGELVAVTGDTSSSDVPLIPGLLPA